MSDPRIFFAAERTLLAWVRSGLTVMALGLVVAKFGLILTLLSSGRTIRSDIYNVHGITGWIGITLVAVGAIAVLGAVHNYRIFVASLRKDDVPVMGFRSLTDVFALVVGIVGLLLTACLILT
jgi:putative membrane protein